MLANANKKLGLEMAVMKTGEHGPKALTSTGFAAKARVEESVASQCVEQIEMLLKQGAQLLLGSDQEEKAVTFSQSSIEDILAHYSQTKEVEPSGSGGGPRQREIGSGSAFSQATIVSEDGAAIKMDDPNFWRKMLGEWTRGQAGVRG